MPLRRVREPFDAPGWLYEWKLDGFRALTHVDGGGARLVSRNGQTFKGFAPLCAELASVVGRPAILDGELVCLAADGRSDFDALFYRRAEPYFIAFDLLLIGRKDLRLRPLLETEAPPPRTRWPPTWPRPLPLACKAERHCPLRPRLPVGS